MQIATCSWEQHHIPLKSPFSISFHTVSGVDLVAVLLEGTNGCRGIGVAAPFEPVTGESVVTTTSAIAQACDWLRGQPMENPQPLCRALQGMLHDAPAARAAVDMAVFDLWAHSSGKPLAVLLGGQLRPVPTSMTLGIRPLPDSLDEAREFTGMGYEILKIKGGQSVDHDVELLTRLRETYGDTIALRVDLNQGYSHGELAAFIHRTRALNLEMIEQPLAVGDEKEMLLFTEEQRAAMALDESLQSPEDALRFSQIPRPAGVYNIKLMKCGGVHPALQIACLAEVAKLQLMWGCMIESRVGLAATLHTALACPQTRFLDLDGDYDLAHDIAEGGFLFEHGCVIALDSPGLGVALT